MGVCVGIEGCAGLLIEASPCLLGGDVESMAEIGSLVRVSGFSRFASRASTLEESSSSPVTGENARFRTMLWGGLGGEGRAMFSFWVISRVALVFFVGELAISVLTDVCVLEWANVELPVSRNGCRSLRCSACARVRIINRDRATVPGTNIGASFFSRMLDL